MGINHGEAPEPPPPGLEDMADERDHEGNYPPYKNTPRDPRKEFLRTVADKVLDKPDMGREDTYATIAAFWTTYLHGIGVDGDIRLQDYDAALMMDLFKTARLTHNPRHKDSWVDKVGYTVGGYEKAVTNYPTPEDD